MATTSKSNGGMFPEWDVTKIWADMKMPEINVDALIVAQQKNIEAMNQANKAAVEGWQAFAKKQTELWQSVFEEAGTFAQDVASSGEPGDKFVKQAAFAKTAFENSLSNARESQEMAAKTANKAVDIVSRRWAEGLDEMVNYVSKNTPKTPAATAGSK